MSCDEKTALLAKERGHQQHISIVVMPASRKDPKDYEPIFTTADYSYGLSLEELLPFTLDPWWQNVRRLCFVCLWLTMVLTLLAAISIAYFHDAAAVCRANATTTTNLPTSTSSPPSAFALTANGTQLLWASF
ncbi:uncharacterized protein Dwil_GK11952 [Drosophila willistoni]|uniref:Solute carrier family 3 member 2 N-terminal domain-containing protein n=1 Tax=Drosophila willistoni TaxID=7260 RepID=B4NBR6_DROWI|nr:uncharacterized protein LOC6648097 isoform X2 [Drosophila willistoni]EDW81230.1 uncharacterized protein Dwil_GK11952 [Drosophila willistoni]